MLLNPYHPLDRAGQWSNEEGIVNPNPDSGYTINPSAPADTYLLSGAGLGSSQIIAENASEWPLSSTFPAFEPPTAPFRTFSGESRGFVAFVSPDLVSRWSRAHVVLTITGFKISDFGWVGGVLADHPNFTPGYPGAVTGYGHSPTFGGSWELWMDPSIGPSPSGGVIPNDLVDPRGSEWDRGVLVASGAYGAGDGTIPDIQTVEFDVDFGVFVTGVMVYLVAPVGALADMIVGSAASATLTITTTDDIGAGFGTCVYSVEAGIGRITLMPSPDAIASTGDGMVSEVPFGWTLGDPAYPVVLVTDLPVSTPETGEEVFSRSARLYTSSPPSSIFAGNAFNQISLSSPTQLGLSTRRMRWRMRLSDTAPDALTTFHATYEDHPYTFGVLLDYRYYLRASDVTAGWTSGSDDTNESVTIGAGIDNLGWAIVLLGADAATFGITGSDASPTISFSPTTDWYIVELLADPDSGRVSARIYLDGDVAPDWQIMDSAYVSGDPPGVSFLSLNALLLRETTFYVEYDWIQIFSSSTTLPPQPDNRLCEYPSALVPGRYETSADFVAGTMQVWINGLIQRSGVDFHEHPSLPSGSPDDRDHFVTLTSAVLPSELVEICYVQVG